MNSIDIQNFKCFEQVNIPLKRLTVLAGENGRGKSTVIQAILLLRKSIEECGLWTDETSQYVFNKSEVKIELNAGYCLSLGNSSSITPFFQKSGDLEIGIKNDKNSAYSVKFNTEKDLFLTPEEVIKSKESELPILQREFHYLNAERIGPRVKQEVKHYDFPNTGYKGEYVAQLLGDTEFTYRFKVEEGRKHPNEESPNLVRQVNSWLSYLMPNTSIEPVYDVKTLSAQIRIENEFIKGNPVIAPNIGFGISYVLPILVSGLIAKKGSILVIENPEAHLHPSAQSKIARFLSVIADSGVNVIIETHSDHIISGVQISAALKQINHQDVAINFFNSSAEQNQPNTLDIQLSEKGELSSWPKGFFDQSQKDFAELFNIRKHE